MRTVRLEIRFAAADPVAAFRAIADFAAFPDLAEDVRTVQVHPGTVRNSDWTVNFRRGLMRWNEWEIVDVDRLRIEFGQTDGDFAEFGGHWQLAAIEGGCAVRFEVGFDFGIESLAGLMDPIADRVITRVICSVLTGLFGDITVVEGGESLVDLARTA
ncbi:SRPBCC family protein [Actinophytocola sp.]|uniref:type II toxin-antitoxin system RatA family toxin n=1 Tax=Actinophytocola sp. TaxID=1872138 RepID=UPI002D7E7E59|nr:SRPBCC family protein [Actinophytocola sp.]HET9139827.1 SRPBCC family protein [Actinophytocola sp.]